MKRGLLLKIITAHGCVLVRHGKKHDIFINPRTQKSDRIPRHPDINEILAKHIIKNLS
jgi:hypothetical protein